MTILASDTFARANQSGWGTSSGGQVWTAPRGGGAYSIVSNEGVNSSNGGTFSVARIGSGTATSTEVLVRLKPADTTSNIGTIARYIDTNNFYYGVLVGGVARIGKNVSGFTTLASTSVTYTTANFYWLRFNLVSTTLRLKFWQDGTSEPASWTVTTTDSSLSSGGYGLGSDAVGSTSFDSLTVTDAQTLMNLATESESFFKIRVPLGAETREAFKVRAVLETQGRDRFSVRSVLGSETRARFSIRAGLATQARGVFFIRALLGSHTHAFWQIRAILFIQTRATWNIRAVLESLARATFKIQNVFQALGTWVQVTFKIRAAVLPSTPVIARCRDGLVIARGRDNHAVALSRDGIVLARGH